MLHIVINFGVDVTEQVAGFVVPHPPHVACEFLEFAKFSGHIALDDNGLPAGLVCIACFNLHISCFFNYGPMGLMGLMGPM